LENHILNIKQLLSAKKFPEAESLLELPSSGSGRVYFRISFKDKSQPAMLAAYNSNISENIAWYSFTHHFLTKGFRVPEIYARDESYCYFLLEDMGSKDLFQLVQQGVDKRVIGMYRLVLEDLLQFQIEGFRGLDMDVAYPVKELNKRTVFWDLNYFKYYFVKPHNIDFDENKLEDDFGVFADYLLKAEMNFFNYRDFQSRNILLKDNLPYYIDFQGGRQGPLQYDLVSLLYQAKASLPEDVREQLLEYYLDKLEEQLPGKRETFLKHYNEYILFRTLQVFGAYGFRGKIEGKPHFLQSIPFALRGLRQLLMNKSLHIDLPELLRVLEQVASISNYEEYQLPEKKLTLNISSFSYKKKGIPPDPTDNGGGFVFDCRALPNPHRDVALRGFNGTEQPIIEFLENKPEMQSFLLHACQLVEQSVDRYLQRKFNHLQISFGCTGGKHRSVYSAEVLAKHLREKYENQIEVRLTHHQLQAEGRSGR
jgi:aminoglycoside/choline kinase family phosphotransferase